MSAKNVIPMFGRFINDLELNYLAEIRKYNSKAFTRYRKLSLKDMVLQPISTGGKRQMSELNDYYKDCYGKAKPDIKRQSFFDARAKLPPEVMHKMVNDFTKQYYDANQKRMVKLNGYIIAGIDGSKVTVPTTRENFDYFGTLDDNTRMKVKAPHALLSTLYDCINRAILDVQVGPVRSAERDFAKQHIEESAKYYDKYRFVYVFDRGYFSWRLVNQVMKSKQKFVFRLNSWFLKPYVSQVKENEVKPFDITFDKTMINQFRKDPEIYKELLGKTFNVRIARIINMDSEGNPCEEILITNLTEDEFDIDGLREIYKLRWEIEGEYKVTKARMKLEEFSGYRKELILQDFYATAWALNLMTFKIIEVNEKHEIPEDRYKYKMQRNRNAAIGAIKDNILEAVFGETQQKKKAAVEAIEKTIIEEIEPIRPGRNFPRKKAVNKSRMSYRYSY